MGSREPKHLSCPTHGAVWGTIYKDGAVDYDCGCHAAPTPPGAAPDAASGPVAPPRIPAPADDASGAEAAAWQIVARDGTPAIAYVSLDSAMEHIGPGETMRPLYAAPLPARREEAVVEARDAERFRWLMSRNFGFAFDAEKCGISTGRWGKWPEEPDAQRAMIDRAIAYYAALRGAKGGDK